MPYKNVKIRRVSERSEIIEKENGDTCTITLRPGNKVITAVCSCNPDNRVNFDSREDGIDWCVNH